jgi:hypothetical protein
LGGGSGKTDAEKEGHQNWKHAGQGQDGTSQFLGGDSGQESHKRGHFCCEEGLYLLCSVASMSWPRRFALPSLMLLHPTIFSDGDARWLPSGAGTLNHDSLYLGSESVENSSDGRSHENQPRWKAGVTGQTGRDNAEFLGGSDVEKSSHGRSHENGPRWNAGGTGQIGHDNAGFLGGNDVENSSHGRSNENGQRWKAGGTVQTGHDNAGFLVGNDKEGG